MGTIVQLNEGEIKSQLGEMVRKTVEETLNAMLDCPDSSYCSSSQSTYPDSGYALHRNHHIQTITTPCEEENVLSQGVLLLWCGFCALAASCSRIAARCSKGTGGDATGKQSAI